jgi:hypothetical protein
MAGRDNGPMTAPAMIELDDLGAEPSAGRPYPAWPRWRAVVAGALVLLCLAVLTGEPAAEPGLSRPLWTVTPGTTDFVVGARTVYASQPLGIVTAHDLATGAALWTVHTDDYPTIVVDAGDVSAVATVSGQAGTWLVDRSGAVLATLPGFPVGTTRSGLRLVAVEPAGNPDCPAAGVCGHVTAWDLGTRTAVWSADIHHLALDMDRGGRVDALATIATDGTIEVRDPDAGAVRDRVRPLPLGVAARPGTSVIFFGTDIVTAFQTAGDGVEVTLFRPWAPGWPRVGAWAIRVPQPANPPERAGFDLSACGRMLCLEIGGAGTTVIDPDRGQLRLTTPNRVRTALSSGLLLATSWIFASGEDCLGCWDVTVVDPVAAGPVAAYAASVAVPWIDAGGDGLLATTGRSGRTDYSVLRSDGTTHTLGSVPGVQQPCTARREILVCYADGALRAWRLPLPVP